jgi:hypothetical protein
VRRRGAIASSTCAAPEFVAGRVGETCTVQHLRHAQVEGMREHAQLDRVREGSEHRAGQHALHHRQHARDVGVAPAEVAIVVDVAEEELRCGAPRRIAEEMVEAGFQPQRLPAPHFLQPAQPVPRLAIGIMQGLVAGQQAAETPGKFTRA